MSYLAGMIYDPLIQWAIEFGIGMVLCIASFSVFVRATNGGWERFGRIAFVVGVLSFVFSAVAVVLYDITVFG